MPPAFLKAEYDDRLARLRGAMQARGLDALVIGERLLHEILPDPIFVDPRNVPVGVTFRLNPALALEEVVYCVLEGCSEAEWPAQTAHSWYFERFGQQDGDKVN